MGAHRLSLPWQVTGRWRALSPPVKFESRIRRGLGLKPGGGPGDSKLCREALPEFTKPDRGRGRLRVCVGTGGPMKWPSSSGVLCSWDTKPSHPDFHPRGRKVEMLVAQSCPTLCDHLDCSLPGSSVHWILQARVLEWAAFSSRSSLVEIFFSRRSSQPRDQTWVSCIPGRFFPI